MIRCWVACIATLAVAFDAGAQEFRAGSIVIDHAWTRPTMAGMPMGVAYFSIRNDGAAEDTLLSASTPVAAHVELHETRIENGMARMRPLDKVKVAPRQTVAVAPGGIHLMLVGLSAPLAAGTRVPLTLTFQKAGKIEVMLSVAPPAP